MVWLQDHERIQDREAKTDDVAVAVDERREIVEGISVQTSQCRRNRDEGRARRKRSLRADGGA